MLYHVLQCGQWKNAILGMNFLWITDIWIIRSYNDLDCKKLLLHNEVTLQTKAISFATDICSCAACSFYEAFALQDTLVTHGLASLHWIIGIVDVCCAAVSSWWQQALPRSSSGLRCWRQLPVATRTPARLLMRRCLATWYFRCHLIVTGAWTSWALGHCRMRSATSVSNFISTAVTHAVVSDHCQF